MISFRSILKWSWDDQSQRLNYTQIKAVTKFFFMVKSFKTSYLIQYHKNPFHEELFLYIYSVLQMELYLPRLIKNHSQISALSCLESVANKKGVYLERKVTFNKIFNS